LLFFRFKKEQKGRYMR